MASIMQGTTPSVTIHISPDDFLLSNVTAIELYVRNGSSLTATFLNATGGTHSGGATFLVMAYKNK